MKMHTQEYKDMMSERKRQWWIKARKDPKRLATTLKKIGASSKKNTLFNLRGENHPRWKGGKYTDSRDGYVFVRIINHPHKRSDGYVAEHRVVMEKILGRYLSKNEDVHHLNSTKNDNRSENLMLVTHNNHFQKHGCPKCGFNFFVK